MTMATVTGDDERRVTRAFGIAVRQARARVQASQEVIAAQCELDRTYLIGIERGVRNPTILSIWRIASALGVRPSDLLVNTERILSADDTDDSA